jgi:hypothetical protein
MRSKIFRYCFIAFITITLFGSCKLWNNIFHREAKRGCPSDGRNVGAERVLELKGKEAKKARKAKFKGTQ